MTAARLERATYCLGIPDGEHRQAVIFDGTNALNLAPPLSCRPSTVELAQEIIRLAADGCGVPELLLERLADQVLAAPASALALAIREGGAHILDRGLQLAELVLSRTADARRGLHGHAS